MTVIAPTTSTVAASATMIWSMLPTMVKSLEISWSGAATVIVGSWRSVLNADW